MKLRTILLISLLGLITTFPSKADTDPYAEKMTHGFQLLNNKQYEAAIKEFDAVYWNSKAYFNDALFYIIVCQDRLKLIAAAKNNITRLKIDLLPVEKKALVEQINAKRAPASFAPGIPTPKTDFFGIGTTFGGLTYSPNSFSGSGYFYGIAGYWADLRQKITLAYDHLYFSGNTVELTTASSFVQDQGHLAYDFGLGENASGKLTGTLLFNNDTNTNLGSAYGIIFKIFNKNYIAFGPEFYYSYYPAYNYVSGSTTHNALSVLQLDIDLSFMLTSSQSSGLYLDLKGIGIQPSDADDTNNTTFNKNYFSGELGLRYYTGASTWGIGGWAGKQYFAVQGEGHDLYNTGSARIWKIQSSYTYSFKFGLSATLFAAMESILETVATTSAPKASSSNPTNTQLTVGGLSLNLGF